jgi:hypothetical protein
MDKQIINQTLPQEYKQYQTISFCGNTFKSLKYLIDDNGFIPFMVGVGDIPRLWIYTKKDNNAIVVVRDSVAILPNIKVDIFNREKRLSVSLTLMPNIEETKIFEINFSGEIPIVNHIDLRPIGYVVFGDKTELNIGNQKYQGNIFENLQSLVKI